MTQTDVSEMCPTSSFSQRHDAIESLLVEGRLTDASTALLALEADRSDDVRLMFLRARLLEREGKLSDAAELCAQAIAIWPDVAQALRLQIRLAERLGDRTSHEEGVAKLLQTCPDEIALNGVMGRLLFEKEEFGRALPYLRVAAPSLGHENNAIWNYVTALALTGGYRELVEAQPLLDALAGDVAIYTPYRHLAAAKLALLSDREQVLVAQHHLETGPYWLTATETGERLAAAIAAAQPCSLVLVDQHLARFISYTSLRANLALRPQELLAIAESAWKSWFEMPVNEMPTVQVADVASQLSEALHAADIVGVADHEMLALDHFNYGFLEEARRQVLRRPNRVLTSNRVAWHLHEVMPFFLHLLQGLPFLGVVGPDHDLADRLARFCGVGQTSSASFPRIEPNLDAHGRSMTSQALDGIVVPFRGAVFIVTGSGPFSLIAAGRIKELGGIAVCIGDLAEHWSGRR
jgi:tetratricopeptide (TPR) repeat protein